jgi:hypothetical protein
MQIRTPARQPGPRVGLDNVPSRYEAKQTGLDRTLLAAYTGTHRGHTRDMLLGSRGHYSTKSTVSARLRYLAGTGQTVQPSGDGMAGPAEDLTAGSSAGETAASDLMSMRQPVSLAASLAFCPSLPIASDSW